MLARSLPAIALLLAACGPKSLALADEPVRRAAQCGVVAAAAGRMAEKDVKAPLPFEARMKVMHYALITATAGGGYDEARAAAVLKALPAEEPEITGGKWQDLEPACAQAFPTAEAPARLPASVLDAQLGCWMLADYIGGALQNQEVQYAGPLDEARKMRLSLDAKVGAKLQRAGKTDAAEQEGARAKAMRAIVQAGAAGPVLKACVARFS